LDALVPFFAFIPFGALRAWIAFVALWPLRAVYCPAQWDLRRFALARSADAPQLAFVLLVAGVDRIGGLRLDRGRGESKGTDGKGDNCNMGVMLHGKKRFQLSDIQSESRTNLSVVV
jgi:hypothetical protein